MLMNNLTKRRSRKFCTVLMQSQKLLIYQSLCNNFVLNGKSQHSTTPTFKDRFQGQGHFSIPSMIPLVRSVSSSELSWELATSLEGDLLGFLLTLQPLALLADLGPGNLLTNALSMYLARINDSRIDLLLKCNKIWL